ncbi:porin family protein [Bacteroidota bacterium]
MKNHLPLLIISLFLVLDHECYSQISIKAGLTASSFSYVNTPPSPYKDYDIDLRPYLGYDIEWIQLGEQNPLITPYLSICYSIGITKRLLVRPELSLVQKGVSFNRYDFEKITYQVKISYLELPVSLVYEIRPEKRLSFDLYAGGFFAYKIRGIKKTGSHFAGESINHLDNVEDLEIGIQAGFSTKYQVGKNKILFDLRVFQGLSDVFDLLHEDVRMYNSVQDVRNSGINLSFGYEF